MPSSQIVRAEIKVKATRAGSSAGTSTRTSSGPNRSAGTATSKRRRKRARRAASGPPPVDRHVPPAGMTLEQWQAALRRQYGRGQSFKLTNLGGDPIFSEFRVENPVSKGVYRVVIRGLQPGENSCTCPDFSTNELGTCKHIEFTLAKLERRRGGKAALARGHQPTYSEILLRHGAHRDVVFRPGTACPPALRSLARTWFDADGLLREAHHADFERFLAAAERSRHELRCAPDALAFVAEHRDAATRRRRIAEAFPRGARSPGFAKLLRTELLDYQKEGALFAAAAGRSLIGDEMGLGKTVQALAAAEIMARHLDVERVLVVCPTSLKHQWAREVERFTARTAVVVGGGRGRRRERFAEPSFLKIINYDTVHRDLDLIAGWEPDLVILDEAQRIKNWSTRAARSVKRIASPYAIVLTGTPLENRLEELISIVDFVDRHRLGPTYRLLAEHQIRDPESTRVVGYKGLDGIGRTLAPIMIRRRKQDVAIQLPERVDKTWFVPMCAQQRGIHAENAESVARIVQRWRRTRHLTESDRLRLMVALQNMRMVCDSTHLVDRATDHGTKPDEIATLVAEALEEPGTKVVVFSQWVRMHELLVGRLARRRVQPAFFHGSLSNDERSALVTRFRDDPACRVFLSTDAGGVGLNLQHASVVVNADLPWNPAVLEQRVGRVHRLGQKRMVQVYNFVSRGGIEEGMLELLKFKRSLFSGALDGETSEVFLSGSTLSRFMKAVEQATAAVPAMAADEAGDDAGGASAEVAAEASEAAGVSGAAGGRQPQAGPSPSTGLPTAQESNRASRGASTGGASEDRGQAAVDDSRGAEGRPEQSTGSSSVQDDLAMLVRQGLSLLTPLVERLLDSSGESEASRRRATGDGAKEGAAAPMDDDHPADPRSRRTDWHHGMLRRDPATGDTYLHLPAPGPEVIEAVAAAATRLLERLRGVHAR